LSSLVIYRSANQPLWFGSEHREVADRDGPWQILLHQPGMSYCRPHGRQRRVSACRGSYSAMFSIYRSRSPKEGHAKLSLINVIDCCTLLKCGSVSGYRFSCGKYRPM